MSAVAVLLIAVGIADGWRRLSRAVWPPLVTGPAVVVVACAALCGLWHARDIVPLGSAAPAAVAWELSCLRSERTGRHQRPALTVMVVALTVLIILSGLGSHAGGVAARWAHWVALPLGTVTPTRLLMVPPSTSGSTRRSRSRPRAPGWSAMTASTSATLTSVALANESSRWTAYSRLVVRRPMSKAVRAGLVTGIPSTVSISVGSTVSVCTVIPAGGRRLACASAAGAHFAPSKAAAELPATTARRRYHSHAACARWLAVSSMPDGT
ncbi:hypothetical protein A4G28_11045 [Mycobacterium ostraviense]|uniref:Uncharacterized protein n=1 Tax=Mycobacterium ostraviense TaxID=2738409 RepID=A0A164BCN4_9MYCO|nr:hypothetical protein A4G28_11045 [Mycobacterium ostraviense]